MVRYSGLAVVMIILLVVYPGCRPALDTDEEDQTPIHTRLETLRDLMKDGDAAKALTVFKEVEPRLERGETLYQAWLYFALNGIEATVRAEYAEKFLDTTQIPDDLQEGKLKVCQQMAADAKEKNNLKAAQEWLTRAMGETDDKSLKAVLEAEITQWQLLGKPMMPIAADIWYNLTPPEFTMESLKGKSVLLVFRAPWCMASRKLTPLLNELFLQYQGQGLVVIDLFRLYGSYKDDQSNRESVVEAEEVALLQQFYLRHRIAYPVGIAKEGIPFATYQITAIPALFFINKSGVIQAIEIGADSPQRIKNTLKKLLEVK